MNDKLEKRENLNYLSWANALAEFKRAYPNATYRIVKDPTPHTLQMREQGLLYITGTKIVPISFNCLSILPI